MGKGLLGVIVAAVLFCSFLLCCGSKQDVPVRFYGEVIDQKSNPVPDVRINAMVRHWHAIGALDYILGTSVPIAAKADKSGRFKLHGATGDCFGLSLQKEGYEAELETSTYSAVGGEELNPVIFKMYPTNLHERLISDRKKFQIVPDGRSYFINLTNGTISESDSGNLKVWIKYADQPAKDNIRDWMCEVDVIDGGLLQDSSYYRSVAPSEGYVPTFKFQQKIKSGQNGGESGEKRFYLKLADGPVYGKMEIEMYAPFNRIPGLVRLSYAINPSGSNIIR